MIDVTKNKQIDHERLERWKKEVKVTLDESRQKPFGVNLKELIEKEKAEQTKDK